MKYKVAYIEDNKLGVIIMKKLIEKFDLEFRHFSCPETFLKKAVLIEYDLIISDYMMPMMNGAELSKIIRKNGSNIPIIICSAVPIDTSIEARLKYTDAFISKPVKMDNLRTLLKRFLLIE